MGAICKTIDIHSENLQHLLDYGSDQTKTSLDANDLENLLSYAANPEKTTIQMPQDGEQSLLVTGVLCSPNTAKEEFEKLKNIYRESNPEYLPSFEYLDDRSGKSAAIQKKPVTAIHLIQSFDDNVDPRIAHQIGLDLCERLGVQAVVDTHMNTHHVHNHIIINAYMPDGQTKFSMNNDKRIELRRMSDQIQREYGLEISFLDPKEQQRISKKSLSYHEWEAARDKKSWKERMRADIAEAQKMSDNKDEFVDLMRDFGYEVAKENGNHIMWMNTDNGRTIWDRTLGEECSLCNLFPNEMQRQIIVETEQQKRQAYQKPLSVISTSKYDSFSGRRRTEIELMIRRAIAVIQKVSNYIIRHKNEKIEKYHTKAKLDLMTEAMDTMKAYGINSVDEMHAKINEVGKELSIAKSDVSRVNGEMQYYSVVANLIAEYRDAKTLYDSVQHWQKPHDLKINQFSDRDIALSTAKIAPLAPSQKSELYQMMRMRPNLRLVDAGKGYANISAIQFRQIKDYFKGIGSRPACLADLTETTADHAYQRQYQFLSEKMPYDPTAIQKSKAMQLLHDHGFDHVDADKLKLADIINIENCYLPCPYTCPLISADQQQILQGRLQNSKKTVSRDLSQITTDEYAQIISFLDGQTKKTPQVMQPFTPPSDTDLQKVKDYALQMNMQTTVNIDAMTGRDVRDLYNWMISQGKAPMCTDIANAATWEKNKDDFHEDIKCETPRKQNVLIQLRNAENALAQLGITPDDIPQMLTHIDNVKKEQRDLTDVQTACADQYKQLLRLQQQTKYTKDNKFLYGGLLDENEVKQIEKEISAEIANVEKDERSSTPETKPERETNKRTITPITQPDKKQQTQDHDIDR